MKKLKLTWSHDISKAIFNSALAVNDKVTCGYCGKELQKINKYLWGCKCRRDNKVMSKG